jgi:hypothetical protein
MTDQAQEPEHRRPNVLAILAACIFGLVLGIMGMRSYMASGWADDSELTATVPSSYSAPVEGE